MTEGKAQRPAASAGMSAGSGAGDGAVGAAALSRDRSVRRASFAKTGLCVTLEEEPSRLILRGTADPLLLYFVFGAALAVAVGGSLLISPAYGFAAVILFSVLFSPLLVFSTLGAVRLRSLCILDRAEQRVSVRERSYLEELQRDWPLEALSAVEVASRPASRWGSGGPTYELHLVLGAERYLAQSGANEPQLRREAHRIARFLGVPVQSQRLARRRAARPLRHLALTAILFFLPIVLAGGALAYLFQRQPPSANLLLVSMSVLLVCQVGALLAYGYDRSVAPHADEPTPGDVLPGSFAER